MGLFKQRFTTEKSLSQKLPYHGALVKLNFQLYTKILELASGTNSKTTPLVDVHVYKTT